jgi:hypothetical protein
VAGILAYAPAGPRRTAVQALGVVAVLALLVVLTLVKFSNAPSFETGLAPF